MEWDNRHHHSRSRGGCIKAIRTMLGIEACSALSRALKLNAGKKPLEESSSSTMLIPLQENHNETFLTTPAPRCKTRQGEWRQASNHGEPTNVSISDIEQSARTKTKGAAATAHCAEVKARRHCRRQASKQRGLRHFPPKMVKEIVPTSDHAPRIAEN